MPSANQSYDQTALIAALLQPKRYPHPVKTVEHLQTHISHVLLAGDYAYKIKKPLNLGFLDFTSLERRKYYCEEELRLNGRLAPEIYLDCVPIGGEPAHPVLGRSAGDAIEYAVRMRRFPQDALLDRVLTAGGLEPRHLDALARRLAEFHRAIPAADPATPFGLPERVRQPMLDDFTQTRPLLADPVDRDVLTAVERWTLAASERLGPRLAERKASGWIRECHGDLHLGNMVLADAGQVIIFDCIEFNDDLRWIDVISDLAFLTMDLRFRGTGPFAQRVLNTYLEYSGDFAGAALLSYYQVYRAMVRAKINAIQASQDSVSPAARVTAVLVDATFMKRVHRQPFRELAARHGAPFILLDCAADPETLRARVAARRARGDDAAEADVEVLERQLRYDEPPAADENPLKTNGDSDVERLRAAIAAAIVVRGKHGKHGNDHGSGSC
ncbi:MAG: aminoglycoside phosphotransferase [Proteobacteria bacterium]|nr:aminoglycoside phosphotransferase [Pseudomonadota bacterium]